MDVTTKPGTNREIINKEREKYTTEQTNFRFDAFRVLPNNIKSNRPKNVQSCTNCLMSMLKKQDK